VELQTALAGGVVGLVSGLITAYVTMRFRLREERGKWQRELALRFATSRTETGAMSERLAEQFGAYVIVLREPGKERRKYFLIPGTRLVAGRDASADIPIAQGSRRHLALEARPAGVFAIDLGTSDGIRVNGERVAGSSRLESGDVVTVGNAGFTFVSLR